jgi:DNA helicase HerA-like ATPase
VSETIGRIIGETTTSKFSFAVREGEEPAVFEYVRVTIEENGEKREVLCQVTSINRSDPALGREAPIETVEAVSEQGVRNTKTTARARVIGYNSSTGVRKPRYAPRPGQEVEMAPDKFLEQFTTCENGLRIGEMLTRESVPAEIDVEGLNRHLAILAATGAGKSHTAGVLIEELIEQGASIVAIDPHGDYAKMTHEKNSGFEHTDKVKVFKARNPGESNQIKVKTSKLGWRKLAELAGIKEDFTNQRRIMREAVKSIKRRNGDDYSYSLEDIIDVLEEIQDNELVLKKDREENQSETIEHAEKVQFKVERLESYDILGTSSMNLEELLSPQQFTVLDLSGIPFDAQDLVSELVLDRIYQARVRESLGEKGEKFDYPVFNIIEEAHRLCPASTSSRNPRTSEKISEIASEGRKFGAFLTLITQRPSKIEEDVLSQCNSMIVQRIVNQKDQNSIKNASESMAHDMVDELPSLNVGDAIVTGPAVKVPSVVHVRERKTRHGGDDVDISGKLSQARKSSEKQENTTRELDQGEETLDV